MRPIILVLAALGLPGCTQAPKSDERPVPPPHYSIVADPQGGVWRLNEISGGVEHCAFVDDAHVHCWDDGTLQ